MKKYTHLNKQLYIWFHRKYQTIYMCMYCIHKNILSIHQPHSLAANSILVNLWPSILSLYFQGIVMFESCSRIYFSIDKDYFSGGPNFSIVSMTRLRWSKKEFTPTLIIRASRASKCLKNTGTHYNTYEAIILVFLLKFKIIFNIKSCFK